MAPPPAALPPSLEDQVFGLDTAEAPPSPAAAADAGKPPGPSPAAVDPVTRLMVPVVVVCVLLGVSLWSISKSMQYNEIFSVNPRYQYGLYAVNVTVVLLAVATLCYHQHRCSSLRSVSA